MLRFFENGEGVPFVIDFSDDDIECTPCLAPAEKVFFINSDKSFRSMSASTADRLLENCWEISENKAFELASILES